MGDPLAAADPGVLPLMDSLTSADPFADAGSTPLVYPLGAADPLADAGPGPLAELTSADLGSLDSSPAPTLAPAAGPIASTSPQSAMRFPRLGEITPREWAIVGGGACAGFLLVVLAGWLFLGGRGTAAKAVADKAEAGPPAVATVPVPTTPQLPVAPPAPSQPAAVSATPPSAPAVAASPSGAPSTPGTPPTAATTHAAADQGKPPPVTAVPIPPHDLQPGELTAFEMDKRLIAFRLPGTTWAAAYDEPTGRLAVTHDALGVLIFELDKLLQGQPAPVATIPTAGLPTAVCCKALSDHRVFVIAGKDQPKVQVIDVESLKPTGEVPLEKLKFVDFLAGSPNPQDPYVYYSTQRSDQGDNETAEQLGRIHLGTLQQERPPYSAQRLRCTDVVTSPDGRALYCRFDTSDGGMAAIWEAGDDKGKGPELRYLAGFKNTSPLSPDPFGQTVAVDQVIVSSYLWRIVASCDYEPKAFFRKRPVLFGLSKNEIVFGSSNDYRRLDAVPLPASWLRSPRSQKPDDFRMRVRVVEHLQTRFLHAQADDTRGLGLLVLGEHLVLAPCANVRLPAESGLVVKNRPPPTVAIGGSVEVQLEAAAADAAFEFVATDEGSRVWGSGGPQAPLGTRAGTPQSKSTLSLAAAINARQRVVLVADVAPLAGLTLQLTILIGEERMQVTAVDDFKNALTVQRTEPAAHGVSSPVVVLSGSTASAQPNLPTIVGRTFRWTPSSDQLGPQTIRMRAKSGALAHEWYWDLFVAQPMVELPFYVLGIEPEPGGTRAVVWGQAAAPSSSKKPDPARPPDTHFAGVYDLTNKRLLSHKQVPQPITAATLHESGIYASLNLLDPAKSTQPTPTRIVRLDPETLQIKGQVECPDHCTRVQVIAGRYVAAFDRWRGTTFRFTCPDLKEAAPELPTNYPYPIAGRVRDGWVWDGVVWNADMTEPRLLLFPVHFERCPDRSAEAKLLAAAWKGLIRMHPGGPYTATWTTHEPVFRTNHRLLGYPGGLACERGQLNLYSWADPSRSPSGEKGPRTSVTLVDTGPIDGGYVAEEGGQVYVALQGKLYTVPLDRLLPDEQPFRFVERQERFVLETGKPATLTYSAPGAARYQIHFWSDRPRFDDEPPLASAQSSDGKFQIPLDSIEQLPSLALRAAGVGPGSGTAEQQMSQITDYVRRITPVYQKLTKTKPRGLPFPVYVGVLAEHANGQQKAGLAHSYLIEVPALQLRKLLAQGDGRPAQPKPGRKPSGSGVQPRPRLPSDR